MLSRGNRLTKRGSFAYVYRKGARYTSKPLTMSYVQGASTLKIGYSVSAKVGNAVVRNRYKRWMRAVTRQYLPVISAKGQLVFAVMDRKDNLDYNCVKDSLVILLRRGGLVGQ